jgi:hypothetical protein
MHIMSDLPSTSSPQPPQGDLKTKKAAEVAMTIGIFCCVVLWMEPEWPVAIGVIGIAGAFAFFCVRLLK